jgi:hypothetical protein
MFSAVSALKRLQVFVHHQASSANDGVTDARAQSDQMEELTWRGSVT